MNEQKERYINNFICFDLEGPLSPRDNAYDLMNLIPNGDRIFEVISRYDDLLAMEGRPGYEPGDTLALIVPFLILHHIKERDITRLAQQSELIHGAEEMLTRLKAAGWQIFCITTTYQQYAHYISARLGIPKEHVASTVFPLDSMSHAPETEETALLHELEQEIMSLANSTDEQLMKHRLDDFFWNKIPQTPLGRHINNVKPVGGQRKLDALQKFAAEYQQPLSAWTVVADSITDFKMLRAVKQSGGLAIAFNANQYALPYATMSLASTHLSDLGPVLETWQACGLEAVRALVKQQTEGAPVQRTRRIFHWLMDNDNIDEITALHRNMRRRVREKAGELG